jgi:DNA topoisomerase I
MPRLIHVSADDKGYHRKGHGKGFEYIDDQGVRLTDKSEHVRIKALSIPPAWKDVWICQNPDGHLQATGIDARGRKQYLYHEEWKRRSQVNKFDRMTGFGKALPDIRKKIKQDLNKQGWPREKVISLVISLLDQSALRIGNKSYEQENGTFGLTTLKRKHLKIEKGGIAFQFKAKGGLYRKTQIHGKKIIRLVIECSELPGQEVFQYLDDEGNAHPIFSNDVNGYLQEITEGDFTAKDFRTWTGTVGALELLPEVLAEMENTDSKKSLSNYLLRKVSEKLGNTIAVCKAYYVHPLILSSAQQLYDQLDKITEKALSKYGDLIEYLSPPELTALYLIETQSVKS